MSAYPTAFTVHQLRAMEIDIANTARAALWRARQQLLVSAEDRALQLDLKNTLRRTAWRVRAGLALRPTKEQVATWHALLSLKGHLRAWHRRHHTTPPRAA